MKIDFLLKYFFILMHRKCFDWRLEYENLCIAWVENETRLRISDSLLRMQNNKYPYKIWQCCRAYCSELVIPIPMWKSTSVCQCLPVSALSVISTQFYWEPQNQSIFLYVKQDWSERIQSFSDTSILLETINCLRRYLLL